MTTFARQVVQAWLDAFDVKDPNALPQGDQYLGRSDVPADKISTREAISGDGAR